MQRNEANTLSALPLYPNPCSVKEQGVIKKKAKQKFTQHKGKSLLISNEHQNHIIQYYE
jgi:hypothetical protein